MAAIGSSLDPAGALAGIRDRLAPTDSIERHVLAAELLGGAHTVVDVGGTRGSLARFMPGAVITSVNITADADIEIRPGPGALPIDDSSFDASVSLDTLEHIPRTDRAQFVSEFLRIARQRAVLACPLGGPVRSQHESDNHDWYMKLTGESHPWIREHLEHGPPTEVELGELFDAPGWRSRLYFNGDIRETSAQFRLSTSSSHSGKISDRLRWVRHRVRANPMLELSESSTPWTNRVFVVAERLR